jgi:hypothetical protein
VNEANRISSSNTPRREIVFCRQQSVVWLGARAHAVQYQ